MSGIVGILNVNGATVEQEMLERLTDFMSYRGPDASSVWANAAVGLGHTMLRTTAESTREQQPCSIDGQVWISADAAHLIRRSRLGRELPVTPDRRLCFHYLGREEAAAILRLRPPGGEAVLLCRAGRVYRDE